MLKKIAAVAFLLFTMTATLHASEQGGLKEFFPTGVFWPWERTQRNADFAGKELWQFVDETMQTLREKHCNTLWFVNIGPGDEARKICKMAEKHQLKVFLNTRLINHYYHGAASLDDLEKSARTTVETMAGCPALKGYVLQDEPLLCSLAHCDYYYKLMKRADPTRDSVLVGMNRQTQSFLEDTDLPVICSDIYYFGGDKSTNIPNPASASQAMFRMCVSGMNRIADRRGKHSWLMPQMFGDTWGRHYRKDDKMVVEPGGYLHWRMPTEAETRWQIWEAMRCGSKGVVFYVLLPPIPLFTPPDQVKPDSPEAKRVAEMDKLAASAASWQGQELTKTRIEIDPGEGVLQPGGRPTPQMLAMGRVFQRLRAHADLLTSRRLAEFPVFFPEDPVAQAATFRSPARPDVRYGVIVNDDLVRTRQFNILLPTNVSEVKNLIDGGKLALSKAGDHFQRCTVELAPGDGCVLEAEFAGRTPGMLMLHENFAQLAPEKVKLNPKAAIHRFGAFAINHLYGVSMPGSAEEPLFSIENLTNRKDPCNTVLLNLNGASRQGTVYCMVAGMLEGARLQAFSASDAEGEKTNVMHLAEKNVSQAGPAKPAARGAVIQSEKFHVPAVVPVGTTRLEFFIRNGKTAQGRVDDVLLWFVPDAK